jgi:hypothetical protein
MDRKQWRRRLMASAIPMKPSLVKRFAALARLADDDGLIAVSQRKLNVAFGYLTSGGLDESTVVNLETLIREGYLICESGPQRSINGQRSKVAHYRLTIPVVRGNGRSATVVKGKAKPDNVVAIRKAVAPTRNDPVFLLPRIGLRQSDTSPRSGLRSARCIRHLASVYNARRSH